MKVGFVGLTHLGMVHSVVAASKGHDVIGVGPEEVVDQLKGGILPIFEPYLAELYQTYCPGNLRYEVDWSLLQDRDLVFISQDIGNRNGHGSMSPLLDLVVKAFAHCNRDALVVIQSQTPPGFLRSIEFVHQRRLFSQLDTLVFGRAVHEAAQPREVVLGRMDFTLHPLELYNYYSPAPLRFVSYEAVEIAKLSINCLLAASALAASELADVAKTQGVDWHRDVMPTLTGDPRIGRYAYVKPGLGLTGGHMRRDVVAAVDILSSFASPVLAACLIRDDGMATWLAYCVSEYVPVDGRVAIWGLAYKADTDSVEDAPSLRLMREMAFMKAMGFSVHDVIVNVFELAKGPHGQGVRTDNLTQCHNPMDAARDVNVLAVLHESDVYRSQDLEALFKVMQPPKAIIDPYRALDGQQAVQLGFKYVTIGG